MDWEGSEAVEEYSDAEALPTREATVQLSESDDEEPPETQLEPESDGGGTEDEYVTENDTPKKKGAATAKVWEELVF